MTATEILTNCRTAVLTLRKLDEQLQRCLPTGQPSGVKTQRYDAASPGTNNPTAAAIQLYEGLMAQRDDLALQLQRLSKAAWSILRDVRNTRSLVILSNYYLLGMTDLEIARLQALVRETVCRLRHEALAALE